jgi:putative addiction module component (TIGR02574 family)
MECLCGDGSLTQDESKTRSHTSQFAGVSIIFDMTQEARDLLQKALALPENERAELAGNLLSSLDTTVDQDVDVAWQQEVVRRLNEVQSGKVKTIPWEEVQQKGRKLLHDK